MRAIATIVSEKRVKEVIVGDPIAGDPLLTTCDNVAIILAQVSRLIRRNFDARARQIGLTRPQWQVLALLSRYEGINQIGMADILEVKATTLSRMIGRLVEGDLLERRKDPVNRRAWWLYLTTKGKDLASALQPIAEVSFEEALAGIHPDDRATLSALLFKIRDNLSRK